MRHSRYDEPEGYDELEGSWQDEVGQERSGDESVGEEEFTFTADSPSDEEGFLISEEEQAEESDEETPATRRRAA
jgi:hypothetical protein